MLLSTLMLAVTFATATPLPAPTVSVPKGCQFESYQASNALSGFAGNYSVDHPNGDWNGGQPGHVQVYNDWSMNVEASVSQPKGLPLVYDRGIYAAQFDVPPHPGMTPSAVALQLNVTAVLDWGHVFDLGCGWRAPLPTEWVTCLPDCKGYWQEPGADAVIIPLREIRAPAVVNFPLSIPIEFGQGPATLSCGLFPLAAPSSAFLPDWNWLTADPDPRLLVTWCPADNNLPTLPDCLPHCVARGAMVIEVP